MGGKTGSSVPVILMYLFDTPHGREDWVTYPSGSNKSPSSLSPLMVGKTGSRSPDNSSTGIVPTGGQSPLMVVSVVVSTQAHHIYRCPNCG